MKHLYGVVVVLAFNTILLAEDLSHYPAFSWDTVPVYIHFGKSGGALTDEEVKFVARTSNFVCLEKGHAVKRFGSTEKGIAFDAKRLKAANPKMKVLFYWNTFLNYPLYDACKTVKAHPKWIFRDATGEPIYKTRTLEQYNLLDAEFRRWWASVAGKAVKDYGCDGIFMDAVDQAKRPLWMKRGWGEGKEPLLTKAVIDMMQRARHETKGLVVYNGLRSSDRTKTTTGRQYLSHADGATIEHFGAFGSKSPAAIARDIFAVGRAAKSGRIVIVKGWPDPAFNWTNREKMRQPAAKLAAEARAKITFSLACFLVAAGENCYFCYSWGYREQHGSLVDYPEFRKPLGEPKGDAMIEEGRVYTRSFAHASVRVNLEKREATITWKPPRSTP